jgi:hypothetical protein
LFERLITKFGELRVQGRVAGASRDEQPVTSFYLGLRSETP